MSERAFKVRCLCHLLLSINLSSTGICLLFKNVCERARFSARSTKSFGLYEILPGLRCQTSSSGALACSYLISAQEVDGRRRKTIGILEMKAM